MSDDHFGQPVRIILTGAVRPRSWCLARALRACTDVDIDGSLGRSDHPRETNLSPKAGTGAQDVIACTSVTLTWSLSS